MPPPLKWAYSASRRVLIFGMSAAGAALGGFLGDMISFRTTMVAGAVVTGINLLILFLSPLRQVHDLSNTDDK
jgi:predicted MFS family arabinose efflux permease